ncbi:MAG: class I SAM-dependent methyltransferase [Candidatus Aminicenantes bacterium]|nr:class I SAM-dependent methyltransferase [Candidatus Aminicenantes bacterium]
MRKALSTRLLVLAVFLALAAPVVAQQLEWNQYRGYDVPFVPTPPEVVDEMLKLVNLKTGDILYDLGCGDGRIVIAAAKRFGVKALGIDIDPVRIKESTDNAAAAGLEGKVRFIQQDLFEADFKDATVVTMYLLTSVNLRLRPKLLAELKPGTRLVSHSFDMGEWKADKTSLIETSYGDVRDVHFWIVPANVSGRWEWELPDGAKKRRYAIQAVQEFQSVSASGTEGTWLVAVNDVVLAGDKIKFRLDAETDGKMASFDYEGTVQGDTITGTVRPAGNAKAAPVKWTAKRDPKSAVPIAK